MRARVAPSTPPYTPRPPLREDLDVDVAVIGGGFTGLTSFTKLRFGRAQTLEAFEYADRAVTLVHELVNGFGFDCGRDIGLWDGRSMDRDSDPAVFAQLRADFAATFPSLGDVTFTHAWGGPISVTLDMFPSLGYAGGRDWVYSLGCVGHGVALTQLNGHTIRDLVLERDTDLTEVFFVNRRTPRFPPRQLSVPVTKAIAGFMRWEDRRLDVLPG